MRVPALPNPSPHVAESTSLSVRNLDTNRSYEYFPYELNIDGSIAGISLGNPTAPQAKFGELKNRLIYSQHFMYVIANALEW